MAVLCRVISVFLVFLLLILAVTVGAQTEDDQWWDGFGRAGTTGRIEALAVYDGKLIAAGNFGYAGGTRASQVAAWNGTTWEPLGEGLGCPVYALAVYGGSLYAGGACEDRGWPGEPCHNCVHRWDGVSWEPVGITGIMGWPWPVIYTVDALQVYDGKLYAGGYFLTSGGNPGNYLLQWDGEAWAAAPFSLNGPVNSMAVHDGRLVIGGRFTRVDTSTVNRIVAWDGEVWTPFGTGMDPQDTGDSIAVYALHVYEDRLIAGGNFIEAGGVAVDRLAAWDGAAWSPLGFEAGEVSDTYGPRVLSLTGYNGRLIAGGVFERVGGATGDNIASWDGAHWEGLGSGMDGGVHALINDEGDLYAAGGFRFAGAVPVYHIARWDGEAWCSLGPEGGGMSGWVRALSGDDGRVFAGGEFEIAGGSPVNHVAAWNGTEWDSIGSGFVHPVREVAVYDGRLYGVAEPFRWVGSKQIKRWNGITWEAFGVEFPNAVNVIVDHEGRLLVGGHDAAFWSGISWDTFGQAKKGHFRDFLVFEDRLVAGGYFPAILVDDGEVPGRSVAAWKGGVWQGLGHGLEGPHGWQEAQVHDLLIYDGDLIAAGKFRVSGQTALRHIAVWDGKAWASVGTGVNGRVYALTIYNETVVAAGEFTEAGGIEANRIARWNGSEWSPLGSGVDSEVSCLWVHDGSLYAGGKFKLAGGRASYYMARWEDRFPGMVLRFGAAPAEAGIRLSWRNPSTEAFEGTLIRFSMNGYPAGPEDGLPVDNGNEGRFTGSPARDTSFVHTGLKCGGTYYYTAFAYDGALNYSTAAHASTTVNDIFAPDLAVAVLQNPYLSQYLDVYLVGSEALDPASVELAINDETIPVRSVDMSNAVWLGDYKLKTADDSVTLSACGSDCAENQTCISSAFRLWPVERNGPGEVTSLDGRLHLAIDEGRPAQGTYALVIPCRRQSPERDAASLPAGAALLAGRDEAPGAYLISPPGLLKRCKAHIEYGYSPEDVAPGMPADRLYIEQDGVGRLNCYVDRTRRIVSAEITAPGTFRLLCGEPGASKTVDYDFLKVGPSRPNPFSSAVSVRYEVRAPQSVCATVYDIRGRKVAGLLDATVLPGERDLTWDGNNAAGEPVPSGVYFLRLQTDRKQVTRKLAVVR